MSEDFTDEECIAIAMVHGAIFHGWSPTDFHGWSPIDRSRYTVCTEWEWRNTPSGEIIFETKAIAARRYCERLNLLR